MLVYVPKLLLSSELIGQVLDLNLQQGFGHVEFRSPEAASASLSAPREYVLPGCPCELLVFDLSMDSVFETSDLIFVTCFIIIVHLFHSLF